MPLFGHRLLAPSRLAFILQSGQRLRIPQGSIRKGAMLTGRLETITVIGALAARSGVEVRLGLLAGERFVTAVKQGRPGLPQCLRVTRDMEFI